MKTDVPLDATIAALIAAWDPDKRATHCTNCRHAIVIGPADLPRARCQLGRGRTHGAAMSLVPLLRPHYPKGWRAADDCDGFVSMSD